MDSSQFLEVDENILKPVLKLYHRTKDSFDEDVSRLEKWMKTQPHLPEILGKRAISNFLLLNKCSIEKAKQRIDMYYSIRSRIPDAFENINPKLPNMMEFMDIVYFTVLPKVTKENYRVYFFKIRNKDFLNKVDPYDLLSSIVNIQELRLAEDYMVGDIGVYDIEGVTFSFISKFTPPVLAKMIAFYEKVYSTPLKGLYFLNSTPIVDTVLTLLKGVMKPKVFERVHACQDMSFIRNLPKEIIPRDYGGEEKSLEELNELLKSKLVQYQGRFDKLDKMRVDENLRPEKLKNDELLGFHGNFRRLNVD